jgi:hypothetical protein
MRRKRYHWFLIVRGTVCDVLCSVSLVSPTVPDGWRVVQYMGSSLR